MLALVGAEKMGKLKKNRVDNNQSIWYNTFYDVRKIGEIQLIGGVFMIEFIVVDDEPYVTKMFSSIIDWTNYDFKIVNAFNSSSQALEWLKNNRVDVVFTDISMPVMSGIELAKAYHKICPNSIIVFFTAYRSFDYAVKAIKYNVFDYIVKPIDAHSLIDTITKIKTTIGNSNPEYIEEHPKNEFVLSNDIIIKAKQYMKDHLSDGISMSDVADHVGLNTSYFSTFFKNKTNETPVMFLKRIRMEKAKELVKNEGVKLSSIPYMIGFNSYSYFTKIFQETFGKSPIECRKYGFDTDKKDES